MLLVEACEATAAAARLPPLRGLAWIARPLSYNRFKARIPISYYDFIWTDEIVEHLAEHGVSQDDFEHVVCNPERKGFSRSSQLPAAWGHTVDGRYLMAVYKELDDITLIPVTAFEVAEPS